MFKKYAFTLSEVLITLAVIGVTAAICSPSIVHNMDKIQYKTPLKKNYSTLSQAFNLEYGYYFYDDYMDWDFKHENSFTVDVYKHLSRHLNVTYVCGRKYEDNECFAPAKAKNGKVAKYFTTTGFASNFAHLYTFVLSDGTSVALDVWLKASIQNYAGVHKNLIKESDNLVILVDVNGPKKPNVVGRDVHLFVLTNKGLVPAGADNKSKFCDNKSIDYNYDCTAKMLKSF